MAIGFVLGNEGTAELGFWVRPISLHGFVVVAVCGVADVFGRRSDKTLQNFELTGVKNGLMEHLGRKALDSAKILRCALT